MPRAIIRLVALLVILALLPSTVHSQNGDNRLVVRGLSFDGNDAIEDFTLRTSIATSQSSAFARWPLLRWIGLGDKRLLNETELRRDVLRILALYSRSGFREVSVDTVVRRTEKDVHVRFVINEGRPIRVTSVSITGADTAFSERTLLRQIPLWVGDPFNLYLLQASADSIGAFLRDRGYPFPEVFLNYEVIRDDYTAEVSLEVLTGPQARVAAIDVSGTNEIDEGVVRRAITVQPGQWFSERALYQSQLDLYRMNVFSVASVALADTMSADPSDTAVTVQVRVTEGALRRIRAGAGYGTVDCFRMLAGWTVYDFLGGGRSFDLSTRLSKIGVATPFDADLEQNVVCQGLDDEKGTGRLTLNYNVTASLREPFFLSRRTTAALSFTAERHSEFQAFLRNSVGGAFSVTWRTPIEVPVTVSYALSRGRTQAEPAIFCAFLNVCRAEDTKVFTEPLGRSTVALNFIWDRSDSPLDPTRGTRLTGELRYASTRIGSDPLIQFTRGLVEFASYHRIAPRSVFAWRVRFGATGTPRRDGFVPPEDRFYGGGPNSVRGFSQNELGPLVRLIDTVVVSADPLTPPDSIIRLSATGGDRLLLANAELRFPLPGFSGRMAGALFVDAGQVILRGADDLKLADLRVTPGVGFRLATPLGPVRLDVAYNPYPVRSGPLFEEQENGVPGCEDRSLPSCQLVEVQSQYPGRDFFDRFRVHFSIGQAF